MLLAGWYYIQVCAQAKYSESYRRYSVQFPSVYQSNENIKVNNEDWLLILGSVSLCPAQASAAVSAAHSLADMWFARVLSPM